MAIKELLSAFHDAIRWVLHVILIPVIALLKSIEAGTGHLVSELAKV